MPIVKYRTKQDVINALWKLSDGKYFPRHAEIGSRIKSVAKKYGGIKKLREEMMLEPRRHRACNGNAVSKRMLQFMAALHFTQKHGEVDVNACMKAVRSGEFEVKIK